MGFDIVFNADDAYIPYNAVLIYSIIFHTKKKDKNISYNFHIISSFISEANLKKLKAFEKEINAIYPSNIIVHIINDDILTSLPLLHGNHSTYYRLFIDDFLTTCQKCLYLDIDMLCLADLTHLWDINLKDFIAATVLDPINKSNINLKDKKANIKIHFDTSYFNAGFLFLDLNKFKNIKPKINYALANLSLHHHDQDVLNYAMYHNTLNLDLSYNYYLNLTRRKSLLNGDNIYKSQDIKDSFNNIKIAHFFGGAKPWRRRNIIMSIIFKYINLIFKSLKCDKILKKFKYYKYLYLNYLWLNFATQTPIFKDDLKISKLLKQKYKKN